MSFVGTRPEATKYVEKYSNEMLATLLLPAGITSEASIRYKDEAKLLDAADDVDRVYVEKVLPSKMRYNLESIEQCSVQFQIVDCTEEEEKKIIDLDFALNGAEATVDFTKALNLYLLSIGYIDEGDLEEYRQKVSRLS